MGARFLVGALALLLMLGGCLSINPDVEPAPPATLDGATGFLLHNARVWTGEPDAPWASAVAVKGNMIVAVGDYETVVGTDLGDAPVVVDLDGRMLLPGFIDTHTHFLNVARRSDPAEGNPYEPWFTPWDPATGTLGQTQTALAHLGVWTERNLARIMAGGLPAPPHQHTNHDDHDHDHEDDPSHGLVAAYLKDLAALDTDTLAFDGRDSANDLGFDYHATSAVIEDWLAMMRLGLGTAAKYGVTNIVEAGIGLDAFEVLQILESEGTLSARFNLYVFPEDLDTVISDGWRTGHGNEKARLLGMKIYSDGWLGPRTAALSELYNDRPHRGFAFYTQEEVNDYVLKAHRNGLKVTAHTIGDRAAQMLVTAYEHALAKGCFEDHPVCSDPRFTLEHVQLVPPDLLERMVAIDLVPSIQLSFATSDSPWAELALGADRLEQAYIWRSMLDAGLTLGGSSDFPIEVLPPLWGVQRMVTRMELDGSPDGGFQSHQALDLDAVLRMITIDAAYLTFQEDRLGSITPGKLADLVILEHDLFAVPHDSIHDTTVELTMLDGRVVHVTGPLARELPPRA